MSAARRLHLAVALLPTLALASTEPPAGRVSRLGSEHGLSHNAVYSIFEDRQGFLWIGTVDGLNRYDGYEFRVYRPDPADETSLSNQVVHALLEDRAAHLWVGTEGGLDRFDRRSERFHHYRLGAAPNVVWTLFEDPTGGIWVGTDHGAFRLDGSNDRFVPAPLSVPGRVRAFDRSPDGVVWALVEGAGSRYHLVPASAEPGEAAAARNIDPSWGMAIDSRGRFWTHSQGGFGATVGQRGSDGSVWIGSEGGLCHSSATSDSLTCAPLVAGGSWLDNFVRALHQDNAGAWWIGTYTGLYRYDPQAKPFTNFRHDRDESRSLATNAVSAILEDSAGALWVGTFGGGLDRFDRSTGRAVHHRHRPGDGESLCGDVVWALHEDLRGTLWIGTDAGLCSLDAARRRFRALPYPGVVDPGRRRVLDIADGRDGRLWVTADSGLYALDPEIARWVRIDMPAPAGALLIAETLAVAADGGVWLDTGGKALRRFDPSNGHWTEYPLRTRSGRPLPSEGIWTFHEDRAGRFWLGTGAGLLRFDPVSGTFDPFTTREGLPGSVVYSMLEDDAGRLWLGTSRGLSRFDDRLPAGQKFRNFDLLDGSGSLEFNRRAAFRSRSGEFFFGGVDGLLAFHPDRIREDERPARPALTAIEVGRRDGVERIAAHRRERLILEPRDEWFALEFSALAYADPAKNRYAYRLEGLENDWIEIGTRRVARYTSVPPGDYVFRLKASNHDGIWSEASVALPIVVLPPFWRTPWFALLVVAFVAAALYGLYRLRVTRLLAVERLRLSIAGDLHDDLSTDLSSIALSADLVLRREGLDEESRLRLAAVRDRALRMVEAVRDTVWSVNPQHDTWEALVHRMRTTANALLGESLARFDVSTPASTDLGMAERRTLFLLFKEVLHNVARHAHASRVEIALRPLGAEAIELEVRDDGVGFDPASAVASGGAGLDNLRRRAAELGGDLRIESAPGSGTLVNFRAAHAGRASRQGFSGKDHGNP